MKPFEEIEKYRELAKQGIPFRVLFDPKSAGFNDVETRFREKMLGFDNFKSPWKYCTVLGELANMEGHYVVLGHNGKYASGLHGDCFFIEDDF